jgi:uncharacterized membrane protein YeiH
LLFTPVTGVTVQFEPQIVTPIALPLWIDLGAVAVGAIYGATLATSRKAPLVGVLFMGMLLGFGGSIIRDLLLNAPINPLMQSRYVPTAAFFSIVGAVIGNQILKFKKVFYGLDAVVIGMFVVIGAEKALIFGMPLGSVIFIGTLTAIGGGILGDVLTGKTPDIMSRGPWLASVALFGAIWFVFWYELGVIQFAELSTIAIVIAIRGMSLWRGWDAPMPDDLKPKVWVERTRRLKHK